MKRFTAPLLLCVVAVACWPARTAGQQVETYFSPRGGCAAAIVRELDKATATIDVAAYQLTYRPLGEALAAAKRRGVAVRIVLDRVQEVEPCPVPSKLRLLSIAMLTDRGEKLQHNKYAVIDGRTTLTGSYNWSTNAEENNAENLVVIHDQPTAAAFAADFQKHWAHSRPFVPHRPAPKPTPPPHPAYPPFPSPVKKGH